MSPIIGSGRNQALVRGVGGEFARSIFDRSALTDQTRYQFDQASRVMAIETRWPTVRTKRLAAVDQLHAERGP